VDDQQWLTERFEQHRSRLRAMAYLMLGSMSDADDALQEAWVRLSRSDPDGIDNMGGFLTTVVANVCLNLLRARRARRDQPMGVRLADPIGSPDDRVGLDDEVVLADSVGLALLVLLDRLTPPERLAFVLHDPFAVPYDEIATILG
jgi:RNA polymerase sigma factor (sigma-70 family)